MMKPELSNGQSHFWQWDTGQKIKVDVEAKELHYNGIDGAVAVDGDGWAAVPDALLQQSGTLLGWAYLTDHTIERFTVGVRPRKKPPDYVYTPTEIKTWSELETRLRELEENGVPESAISTAIDKYLKDNPVGGITEESDPTVPDWAKAPEKPTYTAEEVGALSAESLQMATENVLALAKASGQFDGAPGAGLDVVGAAVGQIVKIAAVDDAGAPTAWEPVDMPTGGGTSTTTEWGWELVGEAMSTEEEPITGVTIEVSGVTWCEFVCLATDLPAETRCRIIARRNLAWYDGINLGYSALGADIKNTWTITGHVADVANCPIASGTAMGKYNTGTYPWFRHVDFPPNDLLYRDIHYISLDRNSNTDALPAGCTLTVYGRRRGG